MAKCSKCGKSYSVWTTDLGSGGLCPECYAAVSKAVSVKRCRYCHNIVSPEAKVCPHCGQPNPTAGQPDPAAAGQLHVPDYRVQAWSVILLCCWPLGVLALVNASRALKHAVAGDYQGALRAAFRAKKLCWWGFGIGLVLNFVLLLTILSS